MLHTMVDPAVRRKVKSLREDPQAISRDSRALRMRAARAGKLQMIMPNAFSEEWPEPIIANFINTAALDMAESLAPLPTLTCSSGAMNSAPAKKKAQVRTRVGNYYWQHSELKRFSVNAADWFFTFGYLPILIEPDVETKCPRIRFEDPVGAYPELDRYGKCLSYVKVTRMSRADLARMFPEHASRLMLDKNGWERNGREQLEVVRYQDKNVTVLYSADGDDTCGLAEVGNPISRCPIAVAQRSSLDGEFRGQYDDAIWVQIARAKMASLALEAGMKAVEAPIAVPQDMVDMPIGPDSIWRTSEPQNIRRIGLEVPVSAFQMDARLEQEQMRATRYPEARSGNISASVITGRGVQELMGSYDMQIRSAQDQFGVGLREATEIAFEYDQAAFGQVEKTIYGVSAGAPYKETYQPGKAIAGDYSCDVTYGYAAGMAPNNAVVMMLQLLGAGLVSKESVQKQLPFDVDPVQMSTAIVLERGRDAMLEGVAAMAQAIPAFAQSGQDPMTIVASIATFLDKVRGGADVEDAALAAFTPPEPTPEELAAQEAEAAMAAGGMGTSAGLGPEGLMSGVAPGQAGMAPGGLPDVMSMAAAFRGNSPDMSASVQTRRAIA